MPWLTFLTLIPLLLSITRGRGFYFQLAAAFGVVVLLFSGAWTTAAVLWLSMLTLALIPAR